MLLLSRAVMADKPRVKAPKQRTGPRVEDSDRTRRLLMYGAGATLAVVAVIVLAALTLGGGDPGESEARAALEEAGCTLKVAPALAGEHSIQDPAGTSKDWNTEGYTDQCVYLYPKGQENRHEICLKQVTAQPNQNGTKVMNIDYEFKMELDKNVNIGGFLAK